MKKTEEEKTRKRIEVVCDLVDAHLCEELTKDELIEKLMEVVGFPIIHLNKETSYICTEYDDKVNGKGYFLQYKWWEHDEWVEVTDLSELKIWEYNELVDKLNKYYPDYPIERLDGRFV